MHLAIASVYSNPATVAAGGTTTVLATVANEGEDTTTQPFTVTVALPPGVIAVGPFFPGNCSQDSATLVLTCTFTPPPGLPFGRTATVSIPVQIPSAQEAGLMTGGRVSVASPEDPDPAMHGKEFSIAVV